MVATQLTRMLARNLESSPAASEIVAVAEILTDDLHAWGFADKDRDRISHAINIAGRSYDRWPTPHRIKNCIPTQSDWEWKLKKSVPKLSNEILKIEKDKRIACKNKYMKIIRGINNGLSTNSTKGIIKGR